jgi:hypothetical protein
MIVGQNAVKLPLTEFSEAFRAQLSARAVKVWPCRMQVTTLTDKPTYRQLHVDIGADPKVNAVWLADAVADIANGKCISFALLTLPLQRPLQSTRGSVIANRIDENEISIRMLAVFGTGDIFMRADVLFATRGDHEEEREEPSHDQERLGRCLAEGTA